MHRKRRLEQNSLTWESSMGTLFLQCNLVALYPNVVHDTFLLPEERKKLYNLIVKKQALDPDCLGWKLSTGIFSS